jgi:sulfonate transport system ATP-binding protein
MTGEPAMAERLVDLSIREKRFQGRLVLSDVDFSISRGEVVSLVGPSGCGKSTLLRIVGALDADYQGRVTVLGHAPRLHVREIGFVFQEPRLLPWLTVAQNVGFELGAKGARDPRVRELLAEVGLQDSADAYPKQLSGGMAQRAAIARALFSRPQLLLLDEPFSALDAFTRMRLQDLLLSVAQRHGATLLLVTHDIEEAVYLSDRVVALPGRPGGLAGELAIDLSRPRDRRDPALARLQGEAMGLLEGREGAAA